MISDIAVMETGTLTVFVNQRFMYLALYNIGFYANSQTPAKHHLILRLPTQYRKFHFSAFLFRISDI